MAGKGLRCFYQNTRGLRTKIAKGLRNRITLANHDLVGLTETWLCDGIESESIFDDSYIIHRSDRTNRTYVGSNNRLADNLMGGGALFAIKKNISTSRLSNWELEVPFDNVWLKINTMSTKKLFINCVCINHATNFDRLNLYLQQLNEIVNLREPNAHFIIMGDFNLSNIEWHMEHNKCTAISYEGRLAKELLNTLVITDMSQMNFIKNTYNRILDLIITNMDNMVIKKTEGMVTEDPYHPALLFYLDPKNIKFMKSKRTPRFNFFKSDYKSINDEINKTDWHQLFDEYNVNDAMDKFYTKINCIISKFTPKTSQHTESFPKWFSKKLIELIHEKEYYFKMKKKTQNPLYIRLFNEKRKEIKQEKKRNLWSYQNNIESLIKTNPKSFFSYTKSL